jgi:hypothetical protein
MTDRSQHDSALNGPNREFNFRSLVKFLCLFFSTLAIALSENTLGDTVGTPGQHPTQAPRDGGSKADDEKEARLLEPGQSIKRELAGDDSHTYRIRLSAGQYLKVIVEQQGIDIVARLSGSGGEQISEFDRESRSQGHELVENVAKAAGECRLTVLPRQKNAVGGYQIQIEELLRSCALRPTLTSLCMRREDCFKGVSNLEMPASTKTRFRYLSASGKFVKGY